MRLKHPCLLALKRAVNFPANCSRSANGQMAFSSVSLTLMPPELETSWASGGGPVRGKMELQAMSRYTSPVNPAVFPHLTVVLLAISMFFTAWFFVYEITSTKYTRDIYKELLISLVASLFMGFGVLFLLLWVGIYLSAPKGNNQMASLNPCFCKLLFFTVAGSVPPAAYNKGRCMAIYIYICSESLSVVSC
uniref:Dolichyl-diphosphooligosaccharide-protein glycosyltransferase subunit TMEM258 n=1 Tax=Rhinopithecus roxellana TaxID=61622 RepID=A0A2K6RNY8_RHIRO